jgi:FMN phosphatase YigB (HAD superfamily)
VETWWTKIIEETFASYCLPPRAVTGLFEHFYTPQAYHVYPDATQLIRSLSSRQFNLGILSNSDPRTRTLLDRMGIRQYLKPVDCTKGDHICLSYETGYEKPEVGAFTIAEQLMASDTGEGLWHVGDDIIKDYRGALNNGWNAVLVDREGHYEQERQKLLENGSYSDEDLVVSGKDGQIKAIVRDMTAIERLFYI